MNVQEQAKELLETIKNDLDGLEERVNKTSNDIKEFKEELNSGVVEVKELTEEEIKEKSVDELLNIKHVEDNTYEIKVGDEVVQFERTETKFEKVTTETPVEEIEEHFKRFEITKEMYGVLDHEQQVELLNYFLEKEALYKEMEQMQEEFDRELKEFNEKMLELNLSTKNDMIHMLEQKIELYKKYNKENAIKETHKIIDELLYSVNLYTIKEKIKTIKNPSKIFKNYDTGFKEAEKRFFSRLNKNRKYRFINSDNLLETLMVNYGMEESHAKLFLYVFYNHAKTSEFVEKYSVCFNDIIRNIIKPEILTEEQQKEFKIAMLDIVGYFNE